MHLWRAALVILMAAAALSPCEAAGAESPPPPAAAPPVVTPPASTASAVPPPAQPAQPAAPAATPAKGPPVILSSLPPMSGVFGGKVEFAEKAFPIMAESKIAGVQSAVRNAKPSPCQECRGAGKLAKQETVRAPAGVYGKPILKKWEEDCPACGGYKDVYDQRIGQRLLEMIDRLGHVARDESFDELRKSAESRLAEAIEVRDKILTVYRCKPVTETESRERGGLLGHTLNTTVTLTGVALEPDQQKPFRVEVAPMVEPLWTRVGPQAPIGQAVIIIGTTSDKTEAGGWVWMRMKPSGKGPEAILLCGTPQKNVVPEGKIVLGGLMVGRWSPESTAAPVSPAPATPAPGLPAGSLPVILAVVATEGAK